MPPSPFSDPGADPQSAVAVDLQRQLNELRSELLDERERRIERQLEANGAALVVLAILIGGGGVWFCARLRAIVTGAHIGAALAGAYEATPEGLLPEPGSYHSPPGERRGPLRLLDAPGPEAGPDTVARANGHARASSVAAPRPPAPSCAPSSESERIYHLQTRRGQFLVLPMTSSDGEVESACFYAGIKMMSCTRATNRR